MASQQKYYTHLTCTKTKPSDQPFNYNMQHTWIKLEVTPGNGLTHEAVSLFRVGGQNQDPGQCIAKLGAERISPDRSGLAGLDMLKSAHDISWEPAQP